MARERKRGRRDDAEEIEEVPTLAPEGAEEAKGHGKEKAAKKAAGGGGGFPGPLPIAAGLAAAVLAFAGAQGVGGTLLPPDPYESLDAGGIQAARLLGALDFDRWRKGFGTSSGVRKLVLDDIKRRREEIARIDDRDTVPFDEDVAKWRYGVAAPPNKWRPGLDMYFPEKDPADELADAVRRAAIKTVQGGTPGAFLGAVVLTQDNQAMAMYPDPWTLPLPAGAPVRTLGETKVYDVTVTAQSGLLVAARGYWQPMRNRGGQPEGSAWVILSAASVKPIPLARVSAVAAALALVGGFVVTFLLTRGTKKSLEALATETDAISKGAWDTRVTVGGPAVVQHIGKNLQRIAHAAATGAAAPPQVVVQEVVRAPVQEIAEGLAPSKAFQRPEELEIEATQKLCAEVGCDYYDVVNVDATHVGVVVADIQTRGVRSALHMATVRALFRANCKGQTSPAEVLRAVNRAFATDLPRGVFVTAMYAVVNSATGIVKVASAQHLPLVFWKLSRKASARLQPEGIALGLDPGPVFDKALAEKAIQMEKGDRILLFTDGAIAAKNAQGVAYGEERFYYVVNREAPKNSAACVNFVANDVDLFHEGAPLLDDFTLVTVRKVK